MMAAPQFTGPKTVLSSGQIAGLLAIDAAKRGGFPQLEAAHVALLRADIARNPLSDVRPAVPTASQVATPCVEGLMPTDGAVTANASEVLVADVGSFSVMSTTTTSQPTARVGLYARRVSEITGLAESDLYRLHSSDMGAPGHFTYDAGARGGIFYTVRGLSRLVEILSAESRDGAAKLLSAALDQLRNPTPPPVAPAGRNVAGSWALDWERKQEVAA